MKLTFLGTGTSQGVPMIGCECPVCLSGDSRDKRTRSSVLIEDDINILIDTAPEFRLQALREGLKKLDAVVITHPHADHIMGFDDLRRFCEMTQSKLPIYASSFAMMRLKQIFVHAFDENNKVGGYLHAIPHEIDGPFRLGKIDLVPLPLPHGEMTTLGFLLLKDGQKRMAYLNDCASVPEEAARQIENVPVLIIDGLRERPHPTHLTMAQAVEVGQKVCARKTYLTHITHEKSHEDRQKILPENCLIAYDGLRLEV